ncbi:MAG: response regulator [Flavobacteriales bacterium]
MKDKTPYNILVVEDNLGDYVLIEDYIEEHILSPNIDRAQNYSSAENLLLNKGKAYDVILLDLSLPDSNGVELIKNVSNSAPKTPIVVLAGYSDISFGLKSISMGATDYLLKDDLTSSSLYKAISYSIERKKSVFELELSEKRYSTLFQLSPQPLWVYDSTTLKFLDVNDAAINAYGFSKDEFLQMTLKDLETDYNHLSEEQKNINTTPNIHSDFFAVFKQQKKNGEIIFVELRTNNIFFNDINAKIVVATDVTQKLSYITAIEKHNKVLKDIAWQHSHILRAPLARIMGLINMIEITKQKNIHEGDVLNMLKKASEELDNSLKYITLDASQTVSKVKPNSKT